MGCVLTCEAAVMKLALLTFTKYRISAVKPLINQVRPAATQMPQTPKTGNTDRRRGKPILPMTSTTPLVRDEELHYRLAADLCKGEDNKRKGSHDEHTLYKTFLDALVILRAEVLAGMCGKSHAE